MSTAFVGRGSFENGRNFTSATELVANGSAVGFAGAVVDFGRGCGGPAGLAPAVAFDGGSFGGGFAGLALMITLAAS
jgi:hypothetical protein